MLSCSRGRNVAQHLGLHLLNCCLKCSLVATILATLAGCGGDLDASVKGVVTIGGDPLPTGSIVFHPDGDGPTGTAEIQQDGSFVVRTASQTGLRPGEYVVTITAVEGDTTLPTAENRNPEMRLLVPARYALPETSGLRYTITPGNNVIQVSLSRE